MVCILEVQHKDIHCTSQCKDRHSIEFWRKKKKDLKANSPSAYFLLHFMCLFALRVSVLSRNVSGKVASLLGAVETSCFPACFDQTALHEEKTWLGARGRRLERGRAATFARSLLPKTRACSDSLSTYCWWKEEWFHIDTSGLLGLSKNTRVISDCKIVGRNNFDLVCGQSGGRQKD